MAARCCLCGGQTKHREVTAENWWRDELTLVEHVPAWVRQQCGEVYFDASSGLALDRLRRTRAAAARIVTLPVYEFEAAV